MRFFCDVMGKWGIKCAGLRDLGVGAWGVWLGGWRLAVGGWSLQFATVKGRGGGEFARRLPARYPLM